MSFVPVDSETMRRLRSSEPPKRSIPWESQEPHIAKMWQNSRYHPILMDMSEPGSGKTTCASLFGRKMFENRYIRHVVIVTSRTHEANWSKYMKNHGLPVGLFGDSYVCTYQKMSGRSKSEPTKVFGGLMERTDRVYTKTSHNGNERTLEVSHFRPTSLLKKILRDGTLFIFDESRALVNNGSAVNQAVKALFHLLMKYKEDETKYGVRSRAILLSGTPMDKEVHIWNAFEFLGFNMTEKKENEDEFQYLDRIRKPFKLHGSKAEYGGYAYENCVNSFCDLIRDHIEYYSKVDPEKAKEMENDFEIFIRDHEYADCLEIFKDEPRLWSSKNCKEFLFDFFKIFIIPLVSSRIPPNGYPGINIDFKNGFYELPKDELTKLNDAVEELKEGARDEEGKVQLAVVQRARVTIEKCKKRLYVRIIRSQLKKNPNCKVVFGVEYLDTIEYLKENLKDLQPLFIHGGVDPSERSILIDKFNEPNLNYRLIILTSGTGSEGINLHDEDGRFPRFSFSSPSFRFDKLGQFSQRILRGGVKSDVTFRIVFAQNTSEKNIIENLFVKSQNHREIVCQDEEGEYAVPFPGEYKDVNESL